MNSDDKVPIRNLGNGKPVSDLKNLNRLNKREATAEGKLVKQKIDELRKAPESKRENIKEREMEDRGQIQKLQSKLEERSQKRRG